MAFKFEKLEVWQLAVDYDDTLLLEKVNRQAETLTAKLHSFRKVIAPEQHWLREDTAEYTTDDGRE